MHTRCSVDVFALPLADATVDTVVTDPPWRFNMRISPRSKAVKATDYALIPDDRMEAAFRELARVLKPGGHLYCFCPERKLEDALRAVPGLGRSSGLQRFHLLVWVKTTKDNARLRIGLGHTFRSACEYILCYFKASDPGESVPRYGRRPLQDRRTPTVFLAPRTGGSVKPPEVYARLVRASTVPGGVVLDPFGGTDPLGRAGLDGFTTVTADVHPGWT